MIIGVGGTPLLVRCCSERTSSRSTVSSTHALEQRSVLPYVSTLSSEKKATCVRGRSARRGRSRLAGRRGAAGDLANRPGAASRLTTEFLHVGCQYSVTADLQANPGRRHLERVLSVYTIHYNEHRPHRALEQQPPLSTLPPIDEQSSADVMDLDHVRRRDVLGGLIHEYQLAA